MSWYPTVILIYVSVTLKREKRFILKFCTFVLHELQGIVTIFRGNKIGKEVEEGKSNYCLGVSSWLLIDKKTLMCTKTLLLICSYKSYYNLSSPEKNRRYQNGALRPLFNGP